MSHTSTSGAIDVKINKIFKYFGDKTALNGVSLDIKEGEFFSVIGPSGCGKTTLLRTISGFYNSDKGDIYFKDKKVTGVPPWERNIGFVFQNYALWPNMRIFDNIAYGLKIRKKSKKFISEKVKWALDVIDLPDIGDKFPNQLSGGMQQRVALARAIVIDPSLLLLDEPLSNLDAKLRVSLRKEIKELQNKLGITAIYVTHDQEEALEMSDRIAVMNIGNLQQVGNPKEVYADPANLFVADFIGKANFIEGKIDNSGVFKADNTKLELESVKSSNKIGKTTLMVRPENVEIVSSGNFTIKGKVKKRYYTGNLKKYMIDINNKEIMVESLKDVSSVGQEVKLKFNEYRFLEK